MPKLLRQCKHLGHERHITNEYIKGFTIDSDDLKHLSKKKTKYSILGTDLIKK